MSEPNAAQAAYWNDVAGRTWAEAQAPLDRQLAPLGERVMAALAPRPGERVLDIGCGSGQTSVALARAVGADGAVVGIDLSAPLLEIARRRGAGLAQLSFLRGDAQVFPFQPGAFDGAFSRFGVMFFADPSAAFANIRRALRPGGRLAFVCWRTPEENPVMVLPMQAAAPYLPPQPPPEPDAPGPFAFARAERVRDILRSAGFQAIEVAAHDEAVGAGDLEIMLALALRIGPLGAILRQDPALRQPVIGPVRAALAAYDGPDGVKLPAATWIVTALAPG